MKIIGSGSLLNKWHWQSLRPDIKKLLASFLVCIVSLGGPNLFAKTIFVDGKLGLDSRNGLSPVPVAESGPVRSFSRGVAMLEPGDTLSLSPDGGPYREPLVFISVNGDEARPITIEGNGSQIDLGSFGAKEGWRREGKGWVCETRTIPQADFEKQRSYGFYRGIPFGLATTGDHQRNFVERTADGLLTFFVSDDVPLDPVNLYLTGEKNGVVFRSSSHIVVRHLHVRGAGDDGFSFHGSSSNLVIEDSSAVLCGDEGASAHWSSSGTFYRCLFAWNGSKDGGVVDVHQSNTTYAQCVSAFNRGAGFKLLGSRHTLKNCLSIGNSLGQGVGDLPLATVEVENLREIPRRDLPAAELNDLKGTPLPVGLLVTLWREIVGEP